MAGRQNLTFEGNGATIRAGGSGTNENFSIFYLSPSSPSWTVNHGITIRNFKLVGNSTSPGVYQEAREGAHGVLVDGGTDFEIDNVTVSGVWGDCFYVGSWTDGVSVHDSSCQSAGRNGVSIISGRNVVVEDSSLPTSGYCTFDIEPNTSSEGAQNVTFRNNTAGTWANAFFAADGAPGSRVDGVTVSGNTVTGGTLLTVIDLARRTNIRFTGNVSRVTASGPVLRFAHIDGLIINGNSQPLSGGTLVSTSDVTGLAMD